jgi:hypothetical protein
MNESKIEAVVYMLEVHVHIVTLYSFDLIDVHVDVHSMFNTVLAKLGSLSGHIFKHLLITIPDKIRICA